MKIKRERHPADWDRYGDAAGPRRNQEMIDLGSAFVVAFHPFIKNSRGTRDCARRAIAAGIKVFLIDGDDAEPRRIRLADPESASV
jgi:hypothetical protein